MAYHFSNILHFKHLGGGAWFMDLSSELDKKSMLEGVYLDFLVDKWLIWAASLVS